MTLSRFMKEVRYSRGKLASSSEHLKTIYNDGTKELKEFTLYEKAIGVENIADIARLPDTKQNDFVSWYYSNTPRPNAKAIDLYLSDKLPVTKSLFDNI